jgi:glycine cleavage system H lipoate-binding protein
MVFALVLLTVLVFLGLDLILRREDRLLKLKEKEEKSPIFLSPDRALIPVGHEMNRLYHLSHTWINPSDQGYMYLGFDKFISDLFTSEVRIQDLPLVGAHVAQGARIWDVQLGTHKISQLSPVSGKVVGINPACKMNLPLPSDQVEKSWILKVEADNIRNESNNLLPHTQAARMNSQLRDELYLYAQQGHYLNDGGSIDPEYMMRLSDQEWDQLINKFFAYHQNLK